LREQWAEIISDDSMNEIAPRWSVVHVVAWEHERRQELANGDLVIIERRIRDEDGGFNLIERSMRQIKKMSYGVWFLDFRSREDRWINAPPQMFVMDDPLSPEQLAEIDRAIEASKSEDLSDASRANLELIIESREKRKRGPRPGEEAHVPKIVGKAVSVTVPLDPTMRFRLHTEWMGNPT
jgi:hypothetical protein